MGWNLRSRVAQRYIWSVAFYGAETRTRWKVYQKYLGSSEMCCYGREREKISWTNHVNNEKVLHMVTEGRNVLYTVKRRKANWMGHILCKHWLLNHVSEGKDRKKGQKKRRRRYAVAGWD
jgi:hypothetical protein